MPTAIATLPRRHYLLEPGETLLITRDALVAAERLRSFVEDTGIEPEGVVADPVSAFPMPIHSRGKRFEDVSPDALWNPLFWLPEDIALRFRIRETENAEPRAETDAEWALRIALELDASGLYTAEDGLLDVFALYGINPDDPEDLAAVQGWQYGLPEPRLDSIDLRDHVTFTEGHEAFNIAQEMYPLLMAAQWGYTAASILTAIEEDPEAVAVYAGLAHDMLGAEPSDAPDQLEAAAASMRGGGSIEQYGPVVATALTSILTDYAGAIYELERA